MRETDNLASTPALDLDGLERLFNSALSSRPDIMGGDVCFAGTRIPVQAVLRLLRDDVRCTEIEGPDWYPALSVERVKEALDAVIAAVNALPQLIAALRLLNNDVEELGCYLAEAQRERDDARAHLAAEIARREAEEALLARFDGFIEHDSSCIDGGGTACDCGLRDVQDAWGSFASTYLLAPRPAETR